MIIREKTLRRIISEAMGHRDVDIMILKAYSSAKERGYMVKGCLNSLLVIGELDDVEVCHLADPTRGRRYDVPSKTYLDEDKKRLFESKAAIKKQLDNSSSNTTIGDLAEAMHELSSFLEGAYTTVCLSRHLKPGGNIYFETCALDLVRCYEHIARAYLRLSSSEEKKDQK